MRIIILFLILTTNIIAEEIIGVPRIVDGDTIHIKVYKIRLEGIDAPEMRQKCKKEKLKISSVIIVEKPSQKGIIIGNAGETIKKVGIESRKDLEIFFNKKVFLNLEVKIIKDWRKNNNHLKKLGYN